MANNVYNGRPAVKETIVAGTTLYRIFDPTRGYPPNSFNPSPRLLGDREQGRFEPCGGDLGGYLYVADSMSGVVAEGVLRNQRISGTGLVPRSWLRRKALATLELEEDVSVANIAGANAARLNLDASVLCADRASYSQCREISTEILRVEGSVGGLRFTSRVNPDATALMLITRAGTGPAVKIVATQTLLDPADPSALHQVATVLEQDYGLSYTGGR